MCSFKFVVNNISVLRCRSVEVKIGGSALLGDVGVAPAVDGFMLGVTEVCAYGLAALLAEVVDNACTIVVYMGISPIVGGVY